jgi:hypothetical protein
MASLRAQLTGEQAPSQPAATADAASQRAAEVVERRLKETVEVAPIEAAAPGTEEVRRRGTGIVAFALLTSAFWAGAAGAYLWGYFASGDVVHIDLQLLAFAAVLVLLPPLLFVAAAVALARAQVLNETANQLALLSGRLIAPEETAASGAQQVGRAVRHELDALNQGLESAFGRMRALETALADRIAQLDEAGARAGVKAETIAQRLTAERDGIEALASRIDEAAARAAETLAGRAAQLNALMQSAGGELKSAGQTLDAQTAQFRESAERAATAPQAAAIELDRQAKQIETAADAAVARAEFVLARQERQRAAMNELLTKLKDDGATLERMLQTSREAAEATAARLAGESERVQRSGTEGIERLEAAMAETAERATALAQSFGHDADHVKDTVEGAAIAVGKLVDSLREAAASAQGLIGEATAEARRRSGDYVEATRAQCDQLLKSAALVGEEAAKASSMLGATAEEARREITALAAAAAEHSEKARAALAEAAAEARREMAALPGIAEQHAQKARAALAEAGEEAQHQMNTLPAIALEQAEKARLALAAAAAEAARQMATISAVAAEESERARTALGAAAQAAKEEMSALPSHAEAEAEKARAALVAAAADAARQIAAMGSAAVEDLEKTRAILARAAEEARREMSALPAAAEQESERARATLGRIAEDAVRQIATIPGIAQQEAERVREAMRSETERMLDISARTMATLRERATTRQSTDQTPASDRPAEASMGESLRGMARRITQTRRRPEERQKTNYELSQVLAAADAGGRGAPLRAGGAAALASLQAALADLAADLEGIAGETADPALWRRYLDGDRGVFARRLAASIGPDSVERITALYRDDPRFHEAVETYMAEFEGMLGRAREGDRDGLLASTLLTADTGKIYLAVAYALGRLA